MDIWGVVYFIAELVFALWFCRLMLQGGQTLRQAQNGMLISMFIMVLFMVVVSQCELYELFNINESFYGSLVDSCFPSDFNSRFGSARKLVGAFNVLLLGEIFVCIYLIIKRKMK